MSRIGKQPVVVPGGVTVELGEHGAVAVQGPRGRLEHRVPEPLTVSREGDDVLVRRPDDSGRAKSLHGLTRTLIANMVTGVSTGYTKTLEIQGTGYRVVARGSSLELSLGFSHTVTVPAPDGVTFAVESPTRFTVSGVDKQQVGQVAAEIRGLRPPEPYKGKGVRYAGEVVRRKAGKAGK